MSLDRFAERVLVSPHLADKLAPPESLDDSTRGSTRSLPAYPARPPGLRLEPEHRDAGSPEFPRVSELEGAHSRASVLHFFANHELLALEVMAQALLRFPEAPQAFRQSIASTMVDEQRHLTLYLARMKELGLEFGALAVSDFFWSCFRDVQSPEQYAASMSLTLEQANLDFSSTYAQAFRTVGDEATAALLEEVLADEIDHVRGGVVWLSKWKRREESLWEAYVRHLRFPLTPARAKGAEMALEPRRKAGLSDAFVRKLRVFAKSKGRPPVVFVFDPDSEAQAARNRPGRTPKSGVQRMILDLEHLPVFLANEGDVVLVQRQPSDAFVLSLRDAGFELPEFVLYDRGRNRLSPDTDLAQRPIGGVEPWAVTPDTSVLYRPLVASTANRRWADRLDWSEARRQLFSKASAAPWLATLLEGQDTAAREHLATELDVGRVVSSVAEMEEHVRKILGRGVEWAVLKAPFGTSGQRNRRWDDTPAMALWAQRVMKEQGALVVEPWRERVSDHSILFHLTPSGDIRIEGVSTFETDNAGRYRGAWLARSVRQRTAELRRFEHLDGARPNWLRNTLVSAARLVGQELAAAGFAGRAGIDAFVFRDATAPAGLRLKPLVELNPRTTMGHIALSLERRVCPRHHARWLFLSERDLSGLGWASFPALIDAWQQQLPLARAERGRSAAAGLLRRGVIPTNDPAVAQSTLAVLVVADSMPSLEPPRR